MDTMLTLNIDQNVIENAENFAKYSKKTISQLVEEYLSAISSSNRLKINSLGPITEQIAGIIKLDKDINYKECLADALMEKYL